MLLISNIVYFTYTKTLKHPTTLQILLVLLSFNIKVFCLPVENFFKKRAEYGVYGRKPPRGQVWNKIEMIYG